MGRSEGRRALLHCLVLSSNLLGRCSDRPGYGTSRASVCKSSKGTKSGCTVRTFAVDEWLKKVCCNLVWIWLAGKQHADAKDVKLAQSGSTILQRKDSKATPAIGPATIQESPHRCENQAEEFDFKAGHWLHCRAYMFSCCVKFGKLSHAGFCSINLTAVVGYTTPKVYVFCVCRVMHDANHVKCWLSEGRSTLPHWCLETLGDKPSQASLVGPSRWRDLEGCHWLGKMATALEVLQGFGESLGMDREVIPTVLLNGEEEPPVGPLHLRPRRASST